MSVNSRRRRTHRRASGVRALADIAAHMQANPPRTTGTIRIESATLTGEDCAREILSSLGHPSPLPRLRRR